MKKLNYFLEPEKLHIDFERKIRKKIESFVEENDIENLSKTL